jgi:type III secretory pathway component EscV
MDRVPLRVSAVVGRDFSPDEVRASLARELALLIEDLALPAEPTVDVDVSGDVPRRQFALLVDGVSCPNKPRYYTPDDAPLTLQFAPALHANLEALCTPAMAESLWATWRADGTVCPPAFSGLLRKLVRHRLRIDRIADGITDGGVSDTHQLFETALSAASRRIVLELHPETRQQLESEGTDFEDLFGMMIDGLFYELGVRIGECELADGADSERNTVRLRINDLRTAEQPLIGPADCLVNDTVERLRLLEIPGRSAVNPANGNQCAIVPAALKDVCEQAGLTTWTPGAYLVLVASTVLRRAAAALVTLDTVTFDLNQLAQAFPVLTDGIRAGVGVPRLAQVLRALLDEEISVRDMPSILDAILSAPPRTELDIDKYIAFVSTYGALRLELPLDEDDADLPAIELAECVRMTQKRYISHKYTRGQSTLVVYLVDPEIESRLRDARPLDAAEQMTLNEAFDSEIGNLPPTAQTPVVLTTSSVRQRLRRAVRPAFPDLVILSYQELSPEMNIQPIARISYE